MVVVELVAVNMWLVLTGNFGQENISTPLTAPMPTITSRIILSLTLIPTLSPTKRPTLIPKKCLAPTPLLQLAADYVRDGEEFCYGVSVF